MLEHGGKLRAAAQQYNIPLDRWIDLSTGINPHGWNGGTPPLSTWARLPEDEDGLIETACTYYNATSLLPVAGSQAAIQNIPKMCSHSKVAVLAPSYNEHAHAWQRCGYDVDFIAADKIHTAIEIYDVVVVVNPNNPTGHRFSSEDLLQWHEQLAARNGWLVVDEAFMDVTPQDSIGCYANQPGLIVLRSLGKFFGLAGARVGFILAEHSLLQRLAEELGPWSINGPARWIAKQALGDQPWHTSTREQLFSESERLITLLKECELAIEGGTALFQSVLTPQAAEIHKCLAQQGILTRLFSNQPRLRFGLPENECAWQRLTHALRSIKGES